MNSQFKGIENVSRSNGHIAHLKVEAYELQICAAYRQDRIKRENKKAKV